MKCYSVTVNGKKYEVSISETTLGQAAAAVVSAPAVPDVKNIAPAPVAAKVTVGEGIAVTAPMPGFGSLIHELSH